MKILYYISLLPFLSLSVLSETVDIKLTPLMQTEEAETCALNANIVFQASSKSSIELLSVRRAYDCAKKIHWYVYDDNVKKDIKTGNLIFDLTWYGATHSIPKKISESIEVIYGSKKLKKETHNIINPKGEIALDGFLLSYEISKATRFKGIEITFTSEQSIIVQGLQILADDNRPIGSAITFISVSTAGHATGYKSFVSIRSANVQQVKKVSFFYYPGPYKIVKFPIELTLPLK